jgi:hypothetical protein
MEKWNVNQFLDMVTPRTYFCAIFGPFLSGKTYLCNLMHKYLGFKVLDMKVLEEKIKKSRGTEEEPFEGTLGWRDFMDEVQSIWAEDNKSGSTYKYVLDNVNIMKE